MRCCDIAIIGAGPYGLSAAAHLRSSGLDAQIFGRPMAFWGGHMPAGMLLRSPWAASHLSDPTGACTLDAFRQANSDAMAAPIPLERFVEYGHWFQRKMVPDIDQRSVQRVSLGPHGFRLQLEDGLEVDARRVVVAAGIDRFASRPSQLEGLPRELASHTVEHSDLGKFRGQKLLIIGAGQSALESGALLHEKGASAEIVTRAAFLRFLHERQWMHEMKVVSRLLYAPTDVGPALLSHLIARPNYFTMLPRLLQDGFHPRSIRPAGAQWLKPRLKDVSITTGRSIVSAVGVGHKVKVSFDDGSCRETDHVLLATGYKVNISRYGFLSAEIVAQVNQVNGYPRLNGGFESSVAGLYFIGAPAAWSFGPILRFVAGVEFAVPVVTKSIMTSLRGAGVNHALNSEEILRTSPGH
jgi:cation diffusion facilitator CzcD-associated flavoprotein CzcO